MTTPPPDNAIRISKDEAMSTHVDDMLKRQMSMRGDPGVTRDHSRAWYYQNWFVFGLVGLLGAVMAWALLEPMFSDYLYIQGPVMAATESEEFDRPGAQEEPGSLLENIGSITIKGEKIILLGETKEIRPDKSVGRLKSGAIRVGEEVGAYVHYVEGPDRNLSVAVFIVRSPKPQSPDRARLTLHQLAGRKTAAGLLLFPLVAGLIGLCIGAADGFVCRLPRRALLCGLVGLFVGLIGGFVSSLVAEVAYSPLHHLAMRQADEGTGLSSFGFVVQIVGRSLAWCFAGSAMGLGQGIALRSKRLLIYGLLGGLVGGLLGGLSFDPIDLIVLGPDKPSAALSRLIGFGVIGLCVGGMIGLVELLARDAWLRMTQGPLTGKEFLLFKDVMNIGSSPRSDIYLFNDSLVAENHAILRAIGDECEIEARQSANPVLLNNRSVTRARLRHGDNVTIGRTSFVFQQRKG
jgi:hypothetical protein